MGTHSSIFRRLTFCYVACGSSHQIFDHVLETGKRTSAIASKSGENLCCVTGPPGTGVAHLMEIRRLHDQKVVRMSGSVCWKSGRVILRRINKSVCFTIIYFKLNILFTTHILFWNHLILCFRKHALSPLNMLLLHPKTTEIVSHNYGTVFKN